MKETVHRRRAWLAVLLTAAAVLCGCGQSGNSAPGEEYANYVRFDGSTCYVKAKYDRSQDLAIVVAPGGGNTLPDIRSVYTVWNRGALNADLTCKREILIHETDIIGPHIVAAAECPDGDHPELEYFTGGNHQTNNLGSGAAETARFSNFSVQCDGEPAEGEAFANEVTLRWTNFLQGYNTSRENGCGREILREDVTLTIHGTEISVEISHTALEDVVRKTYYGPQMVSAAFGEVEYVGGAAASTYPADADSDCGNEDCRVMRLRSAAGDVLEMGVAPEGLGDFSENHASCSAFNAQYGKCYFNLIRNAAFPQAEGEVTVTKGYYKFTSEG